MGRSVRKGVAIAVKSAKASAEDIGIERFQRIVKNLKRIKGRKTPLELYVPGGFMSCIGKKDTVICQTGLLAGAPSGASIRSETENCHRRNSFPPLNNQNGARLAPPGRRLTKKMHIYKLNNSIRFSHEVPKIICFIINSCILF